MRKKHKPPHAGTAVMLAATLVVILLISQERAGRILRLEAEIRQEVESRSAQARQEALAGSIQVLQYRYIKGCPLSKKTQGRSSTSAKTLRYPLNWSCPSYMKKADGIRDVYPITGNLSDLCRYRKGGTQN